MKTYDAFISHSSEDKIGLVRPLSMALKDYGAKIWYDEFSLKPGVSLSRSIEKGLSDSKFGIVVLSESFFKKSWTEYELRALNSLEVNNPGVIIPIWYKVDVEAVRNFSLYLSDKLAIVVGSKSIDDICVEILEVIREDLFEEVLQKRAWEETIANTTPKLLSRKEQKEIKPGPIRHKKLPLDLITRIRLIRISLMSVYPHSFEFWLEGFQRDMHPENEIEFWERLSTSYIESLSVLGSNSSDKNSEIFIMILSLLNGVELKKIKRKYLENEERSIVANICKTPVPIYDIEDKKFEESF